jgi:pimeloyl-ACP methyl ester carboxylesterase
MYKSKNIVRSILVLIILGLGVQPCTFAGPDKDSTENTSKFKKYFPYMLAGGAATGVVLATWYAYHRARNRETKSEPTPLNFQFYGNEQGQTVLYSHGYGGQFYDIYHYTKGSNPFRLPYYLFDPEQYRISTFSYQDATSKRGHTKYDQVSLGQETDMNRLGEAIEATNSDNVLVFGVSRGAATAINYAGLVGNEKVKGIILEAPFAKISDVLENLLRQQYLVSHIPFFGSATHLFTAALFPRYDRYGPQPENSVDKIDPTIPIVFFHSKKDKVTPVSSSRRLYIKRVKQLAKLGMVNNAYLVEFENGRHAYCLKDRAEIGELFQNFTHAFAKEYGFAYNEEFAAKIDIKQYQPTVDQVETRGKTTYSKLHSHKPQHSHS